MAEWKQIQKTQRMHEAFILEIRTHLLFKRSNICEYVRVRNDHTLGLGGCAGSEDDLQRIFGTNIFGWQRPGTGQAGGKIFEQESWQVPLRVIARADEKLGLDLLKYTPAEVG